MSDTPPLQTQPNIPEATSPWLPATAKALERLQAIARGNGLRPEAISVARSDEATYRITADLLLQASWDLVPISDKQARGERLTPVKTAAELESLRGAAPPRGWIEEARRDLDPLPGQGWGLDGKVLTLPQYNSVYSLGLDCKHCRGQTKSNCSHCHGRGQITCTTCHGAGHLPHAEKQPCPTCHGRNQINCIICNGTGHEPCRQCEGKGKSTTYYMRRLNIETSFRWTGNGVDLPTPLRRSIDRAGLARLSAAHATITREDNEDIPAPSLAGHMPPTHTLHYSATLPFAETEFLIAGKKHRACVLGYKPVILELPCFLDAIVEKHNKSGSITRLRLYKEAQQMAAEGKKYEALHRRYTVGVSDPSLRQVWKRATREIYSATHMQRWLTLAIGTLVSCLIVYGWFTYGWRDWPLRLLRAPKLVDLALPTVLTLIVALIANHLQQRQIRKIYKVTRAQANRLQWDLLPVLAVLVACLFAYLKFGPNPPVWCTDMALNDQVEAYSRQVDPVD